MKSKSWRLLAALAAVQLGICGLNQVASADNAVPATTANAAAPAGTVYKVTDYGAVGDGKTMNTESIKKAIDAAAVVGGRVIFPAGTFLTGPITLRSHVEIHLDDATTVLFSRKFEDFPLVVTDFEGKPAVLCTAPITGENLTDVSITGNGTFDGQGDAWRMIKKSKLSQEQWDKQVASGGVLDKKGETWYPSVASRDSQDVVKKLRASKEPPKIEDYTEIHELLRPPLVLISNCKNVTFEGVTFRNSPGWNVHLLLSENLTLRHVTLFNYDYAQNGDAVDIDSCRNVLVTQCDINAGDDDICIKSGRDEDGRKRGRPTENVTVSDCTVGTGHGGVAVGSEMSGGVRNINVSNCIFKGTDAGLRFKTTRGRGGTVENINISNVTMYGIKGAAITLDMYYMVKNPQPEPLSERTPSFRQFRIQNITCFGAKKAIDIRGLPELPIEEISLENVRIMADNGISLTDAKDITLRNVHVESASTTMPPMQAKNVTNLITERFDAIVKGTATQANSNVEQDNAPATQP